MTQRQITGIFIKIKLDLYFASHYPFKGFYTDSLVSRNQRRNWISKTWCIL